MKTSFKVTLEIPEGVNIVEINQYIVESIRGCMDHTRYPGDPIIDLNRDSVTCTPIKDKKS